jgi:hypothetical protein
LAFDQANKTAREQFTRYLAGKLAQIRLVEYTFSNNPITRQGHGPRASNPVGERLPDIQEWQDGEATPLLARLGPVGLDTLDTLISATLIVPGQEQRFIAAAPVSSRGGVSSQGCGQGPALCRHRPAGAVPIGLPAASTG